MVPPSPHNFDSFSKFKNFMRLRLNLAAYNDSLCFSWFHLEHPATQRVTFDLTAQKSKRLIPFCLQGLDSHIAFESNGVNGIGARTLSKIRN
jgi:hypothetical protein